MKKIIPFKKNLTFKTNVSEITSISLENTLQCKNSVVEGNLIINGNYKITEASVNVDDFEFKIPVNIEIDQKYITDNIIIDIDDFYYEIINNNILEVNIDVMLDNIVEKPMIEQVGQNEFELLRDLKEEIDEMVGEKNQTTNKSSEIENRHINDEIPNNKESCIEEKITNIKERCIEEEPTKEQAITLNVENIIESVNETTETYSTYFIYIVREGDNLDTILTKYNTTKEILNNYNDISEIKLGDKIIIPENINVKS